MRNLAPLIVAIALIIAIPAVAQPQRERVAGTVATIEGDRLAVTAAGGQTQTVMLTPDAAIYGVEKRALGDIKAGDFVASGGVRGADGKIGSPGYSP